MGINTKISANTHFSGEVLQDVRFAVGNQQYKNQKSFSQRLPSQPLIVKEELNSGHWKLVKIFVKVSKI